MARLSEESSARFNAALQRTLHLAWVACGAFVLGGYSERFSGSKWAWVVLVIAAAGLVIGGCSSLRDFWKTQAR